MFNSQKPLFSKPVLAGIMIFSTLAIWALNSTAPKPISYPEMTIETWQTDSGIPVVWLTQDDWKGSNKLNISLSFNAPEHNLALTDAILSMMLDDPLPLISSTINQRLSPLTASVSSGYNHEGQTLYITANSTASFLKPTLNILTQWLTQPIFKARSFYRWQNIKDPDLSALFTMQQALFIPVNQSSETPSEKNYAQLKMQVTQEQVADYYQQLTQHVSRITLVGNMSQATKQAVNASLNRITKHFRHPPSLSPLSFKVNPHSHLLSKEEAQQGLTQQGIALRPLRSVQDWISLQLWGANVIDTLNKQSTTQYAQLNFILSPRLPWAWWRVQHSQETKTLPLAHMKDAINTETLPSVTENKHFNALFTSFQQQLNKQSHSPDWWIKMATEVTPPNSPLTPSDFAKHYQNAIDTFTQKNYQEALKYLFITSSYQENQVAP